VTNTAAETLAGVQLLSGLAPQELRRVEQGCRWKRYPPHEQIIDRQSDSRDVFFVIEGRVRVVNYSLSGREITLDDVGPGNYFGELAAIDGQPRSASVMALTDCLIASLPSEQFLHILEKYSSVARDVMTHLAAIIRTSTDRIMDLSTLAANNRVHADLLRQARANVKGRNVAEISPIPVHGDIASRVSTTRETVARVMNDLARQGIVERKKDALIIHDVERLRHMVEEVRGV
jgi:CRP-like cAMP-binding protein